MLEWKRMSCLDLLCGRGGRAPHNRRIGVHGVIVSSALGNQTFQGPCPRPRGNAADGEPENVPVPLMVQGRRAGRRTYALGACRRAGAWVR